MDKQDTNHRSSFSWKGTDNAALVCFVACTTAMLCDFKLFCSILCAF